MSAIGEDMFSTCLDLQGIEVPEENPYFESVEGTLSDEDMKTLLVYPGGKTAAEYIVSQGATTISKEALSNLHLNAVLPPASVTSIEADAFFNGEDELDICYAGTEDA